MLTIVWCSLRLVAVVVVDVGRLAEADGFELVLFSEVRVWSQTELILIRARVQLQVSPLIGPTIINPI